MNAFLAVALALLFALCFYYLARRWHAVTHRAELLEALEQLAEADKHLTRAYCIITDVVEEDK